MSARQKDVIDGLCRIFSTLVEPGMLEMPAGTSQQAQHVRGSVNDPVLQCWAQCDQLHADNKLVMGPGFTYGFSKRIEEEETCVYEKHNVDLEIDMK